MDQDKGLTADCNVASVQGSGGEARAGNRKLADIYYRKVMNQAKVECIPEILGEDFIFTIPTHPEVFKGIQGFSDEVTGLHGAFPDVHLNVHHRWVFEDLILGLWTGTGTHSGDRPLSTPAGPLPATGRSFKIEGVSWIEADGVQLRRNLANEDTLRIVHDLGVKNSSNLYGAAAASLVQSGQFPSIARARSVSPGVMAADILLNHPLLTDPARGKGQVCSFFNRYWSAFDNVDLQVTQSKRDDGINAYRWVFEADHVGHFFGIPGSGKRIHHQGVSICITDLQGRIEQMYINENLIVLLGQMEAPAEQ
jgi:steroid delta-isomerase-like uncharacterized protein